MSNQIVSSDSTDPSRNVGLVVTLSALVLDVVGYFGLPVDNVTKLIVAGVITVLAPALTALIIRFKAWAPASVAKLQSDLLDLVDEAAAVNPPAVVTNGPMTPVQAVEAHPGALGLVTDATERHGRHEKP